MTATPLRPAREHVDNLVAALHRLDRQLERSERWGRHLADVFDGGGQLLVVGNGGSAADAQHLTGELVGRFRDDRRPLPALALHADTSSLTAIVNDYGVDDMYARQVRAHGRPGDVLVAISTSGQSANVVAAAHAARATGMTVWALTGRRPNPLVAVADDAITVDADDTATVQEVHGVIVHVVCAALDRALARTAMKTTRSARDAGPGGAPVGRIAGTGRRGV